MKPRKLYYRHVRKALPPGGKRRKEYLQTLKNACPRMLPTKNTARPWGSRKSWPTPTWPISAAQRSTAGCANPGWLWFLCAG